MDFTKAMRGFAARGAHSLHAPSARGECPMKPLWVQTAVWIAAVIAAVLLALANPDGLGLSGGEAYRPQGGSTPR